LDQNIIFYLARFGKIETIKYAIENGANADLRDKYGQTPLYYASREGHLSIVKLLVELGANINNLDNLSNQTALFYAAREGKLDALKYLVSQGADPFHVDNKKQSAINYAKKYGKLDALMYLQSLLVFHLWSLVKRSKCPLINSRNVWEFRSKNCSTKWSTQIPLASKEKWPKKTLRDSRQPIRIWPDSCWILRRCVRTSKMLNSPSQIRRAGLKTLKRWWITSGRSSLPIFSTNPWTLSSLTSRITSKSSSSPWTSAR